MNLNTNTGGEFLVDESNGRETADQLSEAFFYGYGAADSERMTTTQGLSGGMSPGSDLYRRFVRNASMGNVRRIRQRSGRMSGLGDIIYDPSTDSFIDSSTVGVPIESDLLATQTVTPTYVPTTLQTGAVIPGGITTGAATSALTQALSVAPALLQGLTTLQLSQINLQRLQNGLPPLTTGQVLGVAGAPPAITQNMILLIAGGVALIAFAGKKG